MFSKFSFENMTELYSLNLNYNSLTGIKAVSKMNKLLRLYIRLNKIQDITGVKNLERLTYIDAADNKIKDISELQYLSKLFLIGLGGNQIEDVHPLIENPYINKGVDLYLNNNPLSEKSLNEYIPVLLQRGVNIYCQ